MTITQNVASKLVVGFVVASMLFTLSFTPAKAATTDELQAQITALLAQIAALQGTAGQSSTSGASVCPFTWSMDLKTGSTGEDVKKLQMFLNADAETRVSTTGAGSAGMETMTFGPATAAAVSKFQTKYRAEVLTPAGLVNATGFFGPGTRAQANKLCASAPVASDDDANDDDANDDDDTTSTDLSGEASLDSFNVNDGEESDIEEGQEDAEVAEFDVEFTDGDARITRLDVALVDSGTEEDPWDTFEDVSLWIDGEEVARMDANDEDEYLDEDDGSIRFSGLDIVAMEDEELTIVLAVSAQGSVDDMPATWTVTANSIRFTDADDVTTTEDDFDEMGDTVSFDLDEAGGDDELAVKTASSDPDSTTLQLEDDARSDWQRIFDFNLDTDDSINDITINELPVALTVSSSTAGVYVNDIRLEVDGETYDDYTAQTDAATRGYVFDIDGDLVINAGEAATVEVWVEFKQLAAGNEGVTIFGTASSTHIDAEGADTLTVVDGQLSGSVTGETHSLRTSGLEVEFVSADESKSFTADDSGEKDVAHTEIKFTVKAVGEDMYIDRTVTADPDRNGSGAAGAGFQWATTSDSTTGTTTTSQTISAADTRNQDTTTLFYIPEDETRTFTLKVDLEAGIDGAIGVMLTGINFTTTAGDGSSTKFHTTGLEDYKTELQSVNTI